MIKVGVVLGYRVAYDYEKQLEDWNKGKVHERLPYGYYRVESEEVDIEYAGFSGLERRLLPFGFMQRLYFYLIKLPILLVKCDAIWTHFDKDALFVAFLRGIPLLNRLFAVQVSNFIWLLDNSRGYSRFKLKLISRLLKKIDRIVFLSPTEKNKFICIFGCDAQKLKYVPFGINLDAYGGQLPNKVPAIDRTLIPGFVLCVGTDIHRDMNMFIHITKEMVQHDFILATSNSNFLNAEYNCNVVALKASLPEIRWLYINCACVIIPLKYNEHVSGCTTVLEAAAMRKPVVISDVPGIRNYVIDGVTGMIVPVGDDEAFQNAVRKLLNDSEYSRTLGENAYNFVKDKFTSENFAKAHLELTREILNGRCQA